MGNHIEDFLAGAITLGCWVIGIFFFKFWNKLKDRLFLYFGIAFWILTGERLLAAILGDIFEDTGTIFYILRLIAYLIFLVAIIDKNRQYKY